VQNPVAEMKPGMSCSVEVLNEVVPDALVVPLQSVFLDGGETIAFATRGSSWERRLVQTGRSSQTLVEIAAGLAAGETVLLSAPPGFTPRPTERSIDLDATRFPPEAPAAPAGGAPSGASGEAGGARDSAAAGERGAGGAERGAGAPGAMRGAGGAERGAGGAERGPNGGGPGGGARGGRRGGARPPAAQDGGGSGSR
jgi:hypothetical protein